MNSAASGMPQSSYLGPIQFLLLFNDITSVNHGSKLLFADDLKMNLQVR